MSIACSAVMLSTSAQAAASLTFDADTTTFGALDGSGTWNSSLANWWSPGTSTDVLWNSASNAVFGAGTDGTLDSYAINIPANVSVSGSITFNNSGYVLTSSVPVSVTESAHIFTVAAGKTTSIGTNVLLNQPGGNTDYIYANGILNVENGAKIVETGNSSLALDGTGVINIYSGGGIYASNTSSHMHLSAASSSTVTVNVYTGGALAHYGTYWNLGSAGTGVLNVEGGTVISSTAITVANGSSAVGTINLDGGIMTVPGLAKGGSTVASNSTINFNSGTLKASASSATFLSGMTGVFIRNGGAIIDDGGKNIAIPQTLQHSITSGDLAIDGGLTKNGSGTLTNSGANTYTGKTTLNAGVLNLGRAETPGVSGPLGNSPANNPGNIVFGGGTLQYSAVNQNDYSGRFSQANSQAYKVDTAGQSITWATPLSSFGGSLSKSGAGTLTLTASPTYTGNTSVSGGTLALAPGVSLPANSPTITIYGGNVLDVSASGGLTLNPSQTLVAGRSSGFTTDINGNLTSSGTNNINGTGYYGTLTVNGNLSLSNAIVIYELKPSLTDTSDTIVVSNNLSLKGITSMQINYSALANGRYHLISYSGSKTGSAAANLALTLNGPAGRFSAVLDDSIQGTIDLVITANPSTLTWTGDGANNYWDTVGSMNWLNGSGADYFFGGDNVTFGNPATNPVVNLQGSLVPGAVTVDSTHDYTFSGSGGLTGPSGLTKNNTGKLTILTTNTLSGAVAINNGTVQLGNGSTFGSLGSGTIANNGGLVLDNPGVATIGNAISGSGNISVTGPGTNTLSGNNSYTGTTEVTSGTTLKLGSATALGTADGGTTVDSNGVLDLGGQNLSAAEPVTISGSGINGNGVIINSSGTGQLNGPVTLAADSTLGSVGTVYLNGPVSGSGMVNKTGSGRLALGGTNSYSGVTILNAGELDINSGWALGTNTFTIYGGLLSSGVSNMVVVPSVPEIWAGDFTFNGSYSWSLGPGPITLISNRTIGVPGANMTVGGPISGAGTIIKGGGSTMALTGSSPNTWTGTNLNYGGLFLPVSAVVYNGTLLLAKTNGVNALPGDLQLGITNNSGVSGIVQLGADEQIPDTAVIWIASSSGANAWFRLSGHNETVAGILPVPGNPGSLIVENDEQSVGANSVLTLNSSTNYTYNYTMRDHWQGTNTLGLTKKGTGTLTLAGSGITYSGPTVVSAGTLVLSNTTALNSSINNNATVQIVGTNASGDSWLLNGHTLSGNGTWIVNVPGTASFNNSTVAAAGQFQVQSGTFRNNYNSCDWHANMADMDISSGAILDLHADAIYVNKLTGLGTIKNTYANATGYSGSAPYYEKLVVGTANGSSTFDGTIMNNDYPLAPLGYSSDVGGVELVKVGTGKLTLTGANSYTGNTTVSNGTLAVTGNGSIANSVNLVVASGGVLDMSAANGGLTLGSVNIGAGTFVNQTLGGSGTVIGAVNTGSGTVQPGGALAAGTLTFNSGLTVASGSTLSFDLAKTTTVGSGTNDLIIVNGLLDLSSPGVNVSLQFLSGSPAVGIYTLVQYGSFSGDVANLLPPANARYSYTFSNDTVAKAIKVTVAGVPANLTWKGDGYANNWDNSGQAQNWLKAGNPDYFFDGDSVTFDSTGYNTPAIYLTTTLYPGAVTVNSVNDYDFAGGGLLAGSCGLTKSGTGTLIIENDNTYTGGTVINGGTLQVGSSSIGGSGQSGSLGSGPITDNALLVYSYNNTVNQAQPIAGTGGLALNGNGTFVVTKANTYTGPTTIASGTLQLNSGGSIASSSALTNNGTLKFNCTNDLTQGVDFPAVIPGSGVFVKSAANTLTLTGSNVPNASGDALTFSGSGAGKVVVKNPAALGPVNKVTFAAGNSGVLELQTDTPLPSFNVGSAGGNNGAIVLNRATPGAGFVQPLGTVGVSWVTLSFNQGTNVTSGSAGVSIDHIELLGGGDNQPVTLTGNADMTLGNAYITVTAVPKRLQLDGTSLNNVVNGVISDGLTNLTVYKANTSTWTLTGSSTYSGSTYVYGGKLVVNGQILNSSALTVASGGTLAGSGLINSPVTVSSGGMLAPGGASIGTLTVSNSLSLNGGILIRVNKSLSQSNDFAFVSGYLGSGGGTVTVTNLNSGRPLAVGDKFKLFNAPVINGNTMSVAGGAPGYIVSWMNNLDVDGTISVASMTLISTNASLASLVLSPEQTFTPAFASNVFSYSATVPSGSTPTVTAVKSDANATMRLIFNNTTNVLTSGVASRALTLDPAVTNVVAVQVTAQDGVTVQSYTVNVSVLPSAPPVSTNASLVSLVLSPALTFTPGFAPDVMSYAATVPYGSTPSVTVVNADTNATSWLIFNNTTNLLVSGVASSGLTLNPNLLVTNLVTVKVTAQDGLTVNTYTASVVQLPSQTSPAITSKVSGGVLTVSWPMDHLGYRLLVQTNNLNKGISVNSADWTTVPGSATTNSADLNISKSISAEFYRLVYP